jgi:hypothetical protein
LSGTNNLSKLTDTFVDTRCTLAHRKDQIFIHKFAWTISTGILVSGIATDRATAPICGHRGRN